VRNCEPPLVRTRFPQRAATTTTASSNHHYDTMEHDGEQDGEMRRTMTTTITSMQGRTRWWDVTHNKSNHHTSLPSTFIPSHFENHYFLPSYFTWHFSHFKWLRWRFSFSLMTMDLLQLPQHTNGGWFLVMIYFWIRVFVDWDFLNWVFTYWEFCRSGFFGLRFLWIEVCLD